MFTDAYNRCDPNRKKRAGNRTNCRSMAQCRVQTCVNLKWHNIHPELEVFPSTSAEDSGRSSSLTSNLRASRRCKRRQDLCFKWTCQTLSEVSGYETHEIYFGFVHFDISRVLSLLPPLGLISDIELPVVAQAVAQRFSSPTDVLIDPSAF